MTGLRSLLKHSVWVAVLMAMPAAARESATATVLDEGDALAMSPDQQVPPLGKLCEGIAQLTVGQWASYRTDVPFLAEKMEAKFAIAGKEAVAGTDHLWLELVVPTAAGNTILQFLIPAYPYDAEAIQKVVMQVHPSLPAIEYPAAMGASAQGNDNLSAPVRAACEGSEPGVPDTVTVPAGTFQSRRFPLRNLARDLRITSEVPFGVVRLVDKDGKGLELVAHGTGAQSAIKR